MHIPEPVREEAKQGVKEGMKKGTRAIVGELVENGLLLAGGLLGGFGWRFFKDRGTLKQAEELRKKAFEAQSSEERQQLEREAEELVEKIWGWGMADEAMSFSTYTRVATHFQKIGKPEAAKTILATIRSMSESNKERLRRSLNKIASEDDRVERVIQFAENDPDIQQGILDVSNIELKPEEQAGHVLRTEFSAMKERLEDKISSDLEERRDKSLAKRRLHQQRIEEARAREAEKKAMRREQLAKKIVQIAFSIRKVRRSKT